MKKIIKIKLLLVFAVLCFLPITNVSGIEAKTDSPEPVIDLLGNEIKDNDAGVSKQYNIGVSDQDIVSSLIRDEPVGSPVPKDAEKTPAPIEESDDSYIPVPTESVLTEKEADPASGASDDEIMPGEIIIRFKDKFSASKIAKLIPNKKIVKTKDIFESVYNSARQENSVDTSKLKSLKEEIGKYFVVTISDKSPKSVLKIIKALKKLPIVKYAEPNYICKPCVMPNDYKNYNLWNMNRIQMPNAWNSYSGKRIKVGVLDTGIDAKHPDLKNNVVTSLGWNCARKSNTDTLDYAGHGTHVAGIIGAEGNNSIGVVGVNPSARLVPIKICFSNTNANSNTSLMTEGILHAIRNNIPVCNMSYTSPDSNVFREAVINYGENGGTLIVIAGNDGKCVDDAQAYKALAELDNVIMVANSDQEDGLNSDSNYGNIVHVAAPGTDIWSTIPTSINASGYESWSGTSMAAPHVTGVVSFLKGINPDMTPYEIRQVIINCSDPVPQLRGKVSSGGRLNAKNSVGTYLRVNPQVGETIEVAIRRSLGSRSGSAIKMMGLVRGAEMVDCISATDSASAILPNLEYADVSQCKNGLKKYSFFGCKKLKTVVLARHSVKLGAYCFMNCTRLSTIYRMNSGNRKRDEADLTGLEESSGGFAAQTQCFGGCTNLRTIKLPNSKKLTFSNNVFDGCSNLNTVYINTQTPVKGEADLTGLSQLNPCIFRGTGITTVKLPKDVNIGQEAFKNCVKLKNIQVNPRQTKQISVYDNSFYNVNEQCKAYTNQAFFKTLYGFRRSATEEIPKEINTLFIVPTNNEKIGDTIRCFLKQGSLSTSQINNLVILGNATMGDSDSSESARILPNLKVVDMSSFTGSLGAYAFYNCENLETVIRNSSLSRIPSQCFMNCRKLTTIMVGNKSSQIWNQIDLTNLTGGLAVNTQSFAGCIKLTTVKLPSASIGIAGSFRDCTSLSTIYKDGNRKKEGTFDLTGVSNFWPGWGHNFKNTAVETVKLPGGVPISEYCFNNCHNLREILFQRTQTGAMSIGSYAFYGVNNKCKAYMNSMLACNNNFQIKRSDTENIAKKAY